MGALNKILDILNIGPDEVVPTEYLTDENIEDKRRGFSDVEEETSHYAKNKGGKVLTMSTSVSSSKVVLTQPTCYADVQEIAEHFKNKKSVIINLEAVDKEEAKRIYDFVSGASYMVDGSLQKISSLIYFLAPKNIEVENEVDKSKYKQKLDFSWMK
ncbi:MAG: cell division protein SepF [Clostridia bacterium]